MGGGFAVNYKQPDQALPVTEHAKALLPLLQGKPYKHRARAGAVHRRQRRHPADARALPQDRAARRSSSSSMPAMNDLIRPTLYDAYHFIWPVKPRSEERARRRATRTVIPVDGETVDVVGPICESGDYLAKDRAAAADQARRSAGRLHRRRVRLCDEQQLQQPPARAGGAGGRVELSHHPPARNVRGSRRGGIGMKSGRRKMCLILYHLTL